MLELGPAHPAFRTLEPHNPTSLSLSRTRLSVALQKANAACLRQAGRVRSDIDFVRGSGWEGDVEDLLRDAAAAAGAGGFEW